MYAGDVGSLKGFCTLQPFERTRTCWIRTLPTTRLTPSTRRWSLGWRGSPLYETSRYRLLRKGPCRKCHTSCTLSMLSKVRSTTVSRGTNSARSMVSVSMFWYQKP